MKNIEKILTGKVDTDDFEAEKIDVRKFIMDNIKKFLPKSDQSTRVDWMKTLRNTIYIFSAFSGAGGGIATAVITMF